MKKFTKTQVKLEKIVGGGQAIGTLEDGQRMFVWGGLPGETVIAEVTKKKSRYAEGVVTEVIDASPERIEPKDVESYLSTSPWQIMSLDTEQGAKAQHIDEAFELHGITLDDATEVFTDNKEYAYRNKVEYSFWFDTDTESLSLAFFRRGTHGKIPVDRTSLAHPSINEKAKEVLAILNKNHIEGRALKTLLIRCNSDGETAWQLYVKDKPFPVKIFDELLVSGERGEVMYSNPRSPASVITAPLTKRVEPLSDTLRGIEFHYATEGFFQINLPVYDKALGDMEEWIPKDKPVVDFYSGVGTIGLTIGGDQATLVEINEFAVHEMERNIKKLNSSAVAVLAPSERALEYITPDKTIIVDPPRAGLHTDVIDRLIEVLPERIVYLSCNPVTQARDVALLKEKYAVKAHKGYNFFPRTPHTEHLVILDLIV